jgi:hypothetical protein
MDGKILAADSDQVGQSSTVTRQREHLFPPRCFTTLGLHQAIVKAFDGEEVLPPWLVYLKPVHENPNVSWFDQKGRRRRGRPLGSGTRGTTP